ncbi:hypothetical protein PMAYCL1PPCAC_31955, partial [Pristionchus mayeri]
DQEMRWSDGSTQHLKKLRKGKSLAMTSCADTCQGVGHRCCEASFRCPMTINEDGLLQSKEGLFPCGIDGERVPRTAMETYGTSVAVCDEYCGCSENCPKRTIGRGPQKMQILFRTPDCGWSVRSAEKLVRGEYIFSFAGLVCTQDEIQNGPKQDTSMFFDLPPKSGVININATGKNAILTITTCLFANEFKYTNHSCCPNAIICRVYSRKHGEDAPSAISLFARQTIDVFDEIVYDYFHPSHNFPFICKCGGYACRGGRKGDLL